MEAYKNELNIMRDKEIETYRSSLKAENDKGLERLKSDLAIAAQQQQIRFLKLHEKVVEFIGETYAKMQECKAAVAVYVREIGPKNQPTLEERRKLAGEAIDRFESYFLAHEIYLPEDIAAAVRDFDSMLVNIATEFQLFVEQKAGPQDELVAYWQEAGKKLRQDAQPVFEKIGNRFRELLKSGRTES